jgi:hypothetical protein
MAARNWTPEQRAIQSERNTARFGEQRAARIEDVEFLLQWDRNAASVASRAGFNCAATAATWLRRNGRPDLANQLHRYTTTADVYSDLYGAAAFGAAS